MKILIVNTYYYPNLVGGTEQSVKLLAEGLLRYGHSVTVLTGDQTEKKREFINGVEVIRLNLNNHKYIKSAIRKTLEFNNIYIKKEIREIFDEVKPDIVHTNNLFYISPLIWKLAKSKDIKVVHTLRDYWGLCPKTSLLDRKNVICTDQKILCKIHTLNYKNFSQYVDVVTAPSQFTLDVYNKEGLFNNKRNIMIPNAIDVDLDVHNNIITKRKLNKNREIKYIYIGSLHEHKGIRYLVNTFRKISNNNIKLVICGKGPLKYFVKQNCIEDKRISYLGTVHQKEKDIVLKDSDVIIVPSIWYEPFGRVVIEGYKYGLPVIACNIGGLGELLEEDISIAINPNNEDELLQAILKLSNRDEINNYITNMHKYLKRYELDLQLQSFSKLYAEL